MIQTDKNGAFLRKRPITVRLLDWHCSFTFCKCNSLTTSWHTAKISASGKILDSWHGTESRMKINEVLVTLIQWKWCRSRIQLILSDAFRWRLRDRHSQFDNISSLRDHSDRNEKRIEQWNEPVEPSTSQVKRHDDECGSVGDVPSNRMVTRREGQLTREISDLHIHYYCKYLEQGGGWVVGWGTRRIARRYEWNCCAACYTFENLDGTWSTRRKRASRQQTDRECTNFVQIDLCVKIVGCVTGNIVLALE